VSKATKSDITFYKAILLVKIHTKVVSDGAYISIDELDKFLKSYADLEGISCSNMSNEQMQILKEYSKQFACSIGMSESEFDKDNDDLDFNRTEKQNSNDK
jgi:hypothetical protein